VDHVGLFVLQEASRDHGRLPLVSLSLCLLRGGNTQVAVNYETSHNVCTEQSYPYHAKKGRCKGETSCTIAIPKGGVTGYHKVGG